MSAFVSLFRIIKYYVKGGCNSGHGLSAAIKLGTPEAKFLQSGCKLTWCGVPLKQNLSLAPDQKMVRPRV